MADSALSIVAGERPLPGSTTTRHINAGAAAIPPGRSPYRRRCLPGREAASTCRVTAGSAGDQRHRVAVPARWAEPPRRLNVGVQLLQQEQQNPQPLVVRLGDLRVPAGLNRRARALASVPSAPPAGAKARLPAGGPGRTARARRTWGSPRAPASAFDMGLSGFGGAASPTLCESTGFTSLLLLDATCHWGRGVAAASPAATSTGW